MIRLTARHYLVIAAVASAAMLAAAHAFERIGGYAPCLLCLRQREVYWIAMAAALLGLGVLHRRAEPDAPRVLPLLLALVFLTGAAVAAYHAGVEWKWWTGPAACASGGPATPADIAALLRGEGGPIVRCDEAAWRLFGLSMAGWNVPASLALAALGLATGLTRDAPRRGRAHA